MATCGVCTFCGGTVSNTCTDFPKHGHKWCDCGPRAELPISVIIPHLSTREEFFQTYCRPSVNTNNPKEVIIVQGDVGGAQVARNKGFLDSTQPYLFHCDDDVRLADDCLIKLYAALKRSGADFAYCDHDIFDHKITSRTPFEAGPFDPQRLHRTSYISTMSLMRREIVQPWDPTIRRMQDWDFWLSIVKRGAHGVYVPETLFTMHVIDKNISATWTAADWQRVVREKHGIPEPT